MISHRVAPAVTVRTLRPQSYIGSAVTAPPAAVGMAVAGALHALYEFARQRGAAVEGPPFLVAGAADAGSVSVEVGVPVAAPPAAYGSVHPGRLPGGRSVVALYQGPYERMEPCYQELRDWIATHGLEPAGPPREVFLNRPTDVTCADQLLTELVWPVH